MASETMAPSRTDSHVAIYVSNAHFLQGSQVFLQISTSSFSLIFTLSISPASVSSASFFVARRALPLSKFFLFLPLFLVLVSACSSAFFSFCHGFALLFLQEGLLWRPP